MQLALGVAAVAATAPAARAQSDEWLVVVAIEGPDNAAARRAAGRAAERLRDTGVAVVTGAALHDRLASRLSAPFEPLSAAERERLESTARAAVNFVAAGDDDQAIDVATPVLREAAARAAAVGADEVGVRSASDL